MVEVAVGPLGHYAVSSAEDKTLVIWDLLDAAQIQSFIGHQAPLAGVALTTDGKYALTGSGRLDLGGESAEDNSVRLWDVISGEQLLVLEGHTDTVLMVDITPDARRGLSGSLDGTMRLWDLEQGGELRRFEAHSGGVFAVAIRSDGKYALSGSMTAGDYPDDGVRLWDLETGELLFHYQVEELDNSTHVVFNPDNTTAFAGLLGLKLLDLENGGILETFPTDDMCCTGFAITSDRKTAYIVSNTDTILQAMDLETKQVVRDFGPHGGMRTRVALSADDQTLLSSGFTGNLYLWDVDTGEVIREFNSGFIILDIDMTADGSIAITPGPNFSAILWRLDLPTEVGPLRQWIAENRYVRELSCEERLTYSIEPICE
jgi:WD40 repeat protein